MAMAQLDWNRYRVTAFSDSDIQTVTDCDLGLFSESVGRETDLIVGPGEFKKLQALRLPFEWIGKLKDPTNIKKDPGPDADDYRTKYLRYDEIIAQYEAWRTEFPQMVSRSSVGTSRNGRPIYAYEFYPPRGARPRQSVVMICGIHAREWISPAVGMHVFRQMLDAYIEKGPFYRNSPPHTSYHVIPVINPDGYEYTFTNNRFWRKNRRNNGNGSYGVDLNRNLSKGWGGSGSSGNTSSETYRGPSAFSEPETSGFRDWLGQIPPVAAFVDFHSYGQYILWPWGYTSTPAPGTSWLSATGLAMKNAIQNQSGLSYTTGPTSTTLYLASGVTPDYVYDRFNAAAYTIELRDTGEYGFDLPATQITPTQDEAWAAVEILAERQLVRN